MFGRRQSTRTHQSGVANSSENSFRRVLWTLGTFIPFIGPSNREIKMDEERHRRAREHMLRADELFKQASWELSNDWIPPSETEATSVVETKSITPTRA